MEKRAAPSAANPELAKPVPAPAVTLADSLQAARVGKAQGNRLEAEPRGRHNGFIAVVRIPGSKLGDGTINDTDTPTAVQGMHTFESIVAGVGHTCGLTTEGFLYCWGRNFNGNIGDGTKDDRLVPTRVLRP